MYLSYEKLVVIYTYRITISIYLHSSFLPLVALTSRFREHLFQNTRILINFKRSNLTAIHVVREFHTLNATDLRTNKICFFTLYSGT